MYAADLRDQQVAAPSVDALASDKADFIQGSIIDIDGGATRSL